jgi:hypothetical protein
MMGLDVTFTEVGNAASVAGELVMLGESTGG